MYPEIDEAILNTLSNSTLSTLSTYKTLFIGSPKAEVQTRVIEIAQSGDNLNSQTFDDEERLIVYELVIHLKKLKYLESQVALKNVVSDIKTELHSDDFLFSEFVRVGDIIPIYNDKGVLRTASMQLLFLLDEDYLDEIAEITEVDIRGELSDDEEE